MIPLAKRLRHRIRIERPMPVRDSFGSTTYSWEVFAEPRAEVGATAAGRVQQTSKGGEENIATLQIRIRYVAGVSDQMRVVFGEQCYSIGNVDNERQANRTMLLACRALPVGGI